MLSATRFGGDPVGACADRLPPHALLRRQRGLPLPRAGLRRAAVRARRRRSASPGCGSPRRRSCSRSGAGRGACSRARRRRRRLLLAWGAVLAVMNCCFYLAIDRLPLGTVAAIEFLPVIALAALGARTPPQRRRARCWRSRGVYLLTDVRLAGEPLGVALRVRQRRRCSPLYIVLGPPGRAARRGSAGSTGSPRRC